MLVFFESQPEKTASESTTATQIIHKVYEIVGLSFNPKYKTVYTLKDATIHFLLRYNCGFWTIGNFKNLQYINFEELSNYK